MLKSLIGSIKRNNVLKYLYFKSFSPKFSFFKDDIEPYLIHFKRKLPFEKYITEKFESQINCGLNKYFKTEEFEYLLCYNRHCVLEPRYGWLFSGEKVFRRSLPYGIDLITPLPNYIYYKRKKKIKLKEALPLFYNWFNYWHFYNDIMGSLLVLEGIGFDKTIPIIVPEKVLSVLYVKDFFNTDYSKSWNWLFVDDSTFVHLDRAFIVKSFANVKEQFLFAKEIFKTPEKVQGNRKIFLNRNSSERRTIINIEELLPVIESFNFEIINSEGMSVSEQKAIFESAKMILGIHGAGLTNMLFRYPETCTVLELFPKGHYPIHYYWLAKELGFEYDAISGETNTNGSFVLDKKKLIFFLSRY